jgi:hypothetical protein
MKTLLAAIAFAVALPAVAHAQAAPAPAPAPAPEKKCCCDEMKGDHAAGSNAHEGHDMSQHRQHGQ